MKDIHEKLKRATFQGWNGVFQTFREQHQRCDTLESRFRRVILLRYTNKDGENVAALHNLQYEKIGTEVIT